MSIRSTGAASAFKYTLAVCLAFTAVQSLPAETGDTQVQWNRPADLQAIKSIEDRMAASADSSEFGDILSNHVVLVDAYLPAVHKGPEAVLEAYSRHKKALAGAKGRYTEINIISTPTFACSAAQIRYDVAAPDGTKSTAEYRKLDAFQKIAGRWQLVQQHISAAIDPKTGKVATQPLQVRGPLTWDKASLSKVAQTPEAARKGILDWTDRALREVGLEAAMKFFAPTQDVLLYGEYYPGNIRTRAEVTDYYGPMYKTFANLHVKNPLYEVDTDGLLGAQIDAQDVTIDMTDGSQKLISIRQSDCLRQIDGKWETFLEMVSFPVDRDTGKAVMQSEGFRRND